MIFLNDEQVARALDYPPLVEALETAFRTGEQPPTRLQYPIGGGDPVDGHLLLMPAWRNGQKMGIKIVSIFPQNARKSIPTVNASYVLLNANTGVPEVFMDATELTCRRTAAASAWPRVTSHAMIQKPC